MPGADKNDWPAYGRDPGGQRYSPLKEINRGNVSNLKIAWTFRTGDIYRPKHSKPPAFETTPLYVDGILYVGTPLGRVIALDPRERVSRNGPSIPHIDKDLGFGDYSHRGVSTWKPKNGSRRIYIATIDARLIALDAATGMPCSDFGDNGTINLREGLRIPVQSDRSVRLRRNIATRGDWEHAGRRLRRRRQCQRRPAERRSARFRRGHRKTQMEMGSDAATIRRRARPTPGRSIAADPARNLVFVPTGSRQPRLLRRRAPGRRSVRELGRGSAGRYRRTRVAFPNRASRSLGL